MKLYNYIHYFQETGNMVSALCFIEHYISFSKHSLLSKMTYTVFKVYMEPKSLVLLALLSTVWATEKLYLRLLCDAVLQNTKTKGFYCLRLDPYVQWCSMVTATIMITKKKRHKYLQSKYTWHTGSTDGMGRAHGWQMFPLFDKCFHYTYRF